jgi:ADP-ribose pyrophosphatase YjhB (NUDIX family)
MTTQEPAFRFCPPCGGPLEPRQLKAGDRRAWCAANADIHYLDPKVAVGTVITTADDRIVLVRRAIEPGYGLWVFPGGYVDRGEQITSAAIREAREEAGLDVRLDGLINIYSYAGRPIVIVVYKASIVAGELRIDEESLEARLFSRAEIPWQQLAFRSTHEALEDYYTGTVHPIR